MLSAHSRRTPTPKKDTKSQMEQIVQSIQNHIERDVRRTEIAEEFYLNPDYLSRLFKKEMGVQLKDFIVARKDEGGAKPPADHCAPGQHGCSKSWLYKFLPFFPGL